MRARLVFILLVLMACVLLALGFPLALSITNQRQSTLFEDRLDDTNYFAAVAATELESPYPSTLTGDLVRYEQVYGVSVAVVDRGGTPQTRSQGYPGSDAADVAAALRQAFAGRHSSGPSTIWPWNKRRLVVAAPVVEGGDVVGAAVTVSSTERMRGTALRGLEILSSAEVTALLLCLLFAHRVATWMLKPVEELDAVTHTVVATGQLTARVPETTGPPELRRLTMSFNEMVEHVESVMERQRDFVADASHQLRNPLAAVMLRLDHLALGMPAGQEEEVAQVKEELRRLTRVLNDLLDLALAEEREVEVSTLDVTEIVAERADGWQILADQRDIRLHRGWNGPVPARTDAIALGSALDTVLDNALKFSPGESEVRVDVAPAGDRVEIRVADQGPGLEPEEFERIGDRFWRSPRHQNVEGSGLGLAVARTLLRALGGGLTIAPGETGGLVVTMIIPAPHPPRG